MSDHDARVNGFECLQAGDVVSLWQHDPSMGYFHTRCFRTRLKVLRVTDKMIFTNDGRRWLRRNGASPVGGSRFICPANDEEERFDDELRRMKPSERAEAILAKFPRKEA